MGRLKGASMLVTSRSGAAAATVKFWTLVAVPAGVVTEIGPVVAPVGTWATIFVGAAATGTVAPGVPLAGALRPSVVPWPVTKVPVLWPVPPACVTVIAPLVAPVGTVTVRALPVAVRTTPGSPLNSTVLLAGARGSKN